MYTIYHPVDGVLNYNCKRCFYEYEPVFMVDAVSIEDVFRRSQNDFNATYALLGIRSTSVGDVIYDMINDTYHMVNNIGFTEVPPTVVEYMIWNI